MFLEDCIQEGPGLTSYSFNSGMCIEYTVQLMILAWNVFMTAAELRSIQNMLQAYMFCNNRTMMFEVIRSCEQG